MATGKCLHEFKGHEGAVTCLAMAGGDKLLLSGSIDKTMRSWDVRTSEPLMIFYGHEASVLCIEVTLTSILIEIGDMQTLLHDFSKFRIK